MEGLETLRELARVGYTIVPGHGPVVRGQRAVSLVEANRTAALRVRDTVLEMVRAKPLSVEELTLRVTEKLGRTELTPRQLALNRTTITSVLAWLEEEGLVEPAISSGGVVWRAKG